MKKTISYILSVAAAAAAMLSCTKEIVQDQPMQEPQDGNIVTFVANAENPDTKTTLQEDGSIWWDAGDEISIFHAAQVGMKFTARSTEPSASATFEGTIDPNWWSSNDNPPYVAVYPYNENDILEADGENTDRVTLTVPSVQHAVKGSYDRKAFVSLARSYDHNLQFYNLCGGVKFSVDQEGITSVTLKGNNNEVLSGKVLVGWDASGKPVVDEVLSGESSIQLSAPDGETFEKGAWYCIAALPATLSSGFTMTFAKKPSGITQEHGTVTYTQGVSIQRARWGKMNKAEEQATFEACLADNVILYTTVFNPGNVPSPLALLKTEEGVVDHYYDADLGVCVLVLEDASTLGQLFAPHKTYSEDAVWEDGMIVPSIRRIFLPLNVTALDKEAFRGLADLEEIYLPSGLNSIGDYAFLGCSSLEYMFLTEQFTFDQIKHPRRSSAYRGSGPQPTADLLKLNLPGSLRTIGEGAFTYCEEIDQGFIIPASVTHIGKGAFSESSITVFQAFGDKLTSIEESTFSGCRDLQSVTLPSTIKYIDNYAFSSCIRLKGITIPESVEWLGQAAFVSSGIETISLPEGIKIIPQRCFQNCTSLKTISLPSSLTTIGESAFYQCSALKGISIPDEVFSIAERSFYRCSALESVHFPSKLNKILRGAFSNCTSLVRVDIPEGTERIEWNAFEDCTKLSDVTLPSTITGIYSSTFIGCKALEHIDLPSSIRFIQESAFSGTGLKSIVLPEIGYIDRNTFYGCKSLEKVTIPSTCTEIKDAAFAECVALSDIVLPETLTSIGSNAFYNCQNLPSALAIPSAVTTIGFSAFALCTSLNSFTFPSGITEISREVLYGCSNLLTVTLPDEAVEIGVRAFAGCEKVIKYTIPAKVTMIWDDAFGANDALNELICLPVTPPATGGKFLGPEGNYTGKIKVPEESVEQYRSAQGWNIYASQIEKI